ncbi:MAG: O-antigen ligase family protein [FCB group bacterium]|nr:O-antigen ligase family protein [FCB group bacterium]
MNTFLPDLLLENKRRFVELMSAFGCLAILVAILWLWRTHGIGVFFSRFALRLAFEELSCGNSRFMNALFMCSMIPIGVLLGLLKVRWRYYWLSLIAMLTFAALVLLEGSRQTAGGVFLYVLLCVTSSFWAKSTRDDSTPEATWKPARWQMAGALIAAAVALTVLVSSPDMRLEIRTSFVDRTKEHMDSGSQGRQQVFFDSLRTARAFPLFGVADFVPGKPKWNTLQMDTHNGYANLMANFGFPPLILVLFTIAACLRWGYRRRANAGQNRDIWIVAVSGVVVYFGWSVHFNDILQDYFPFFLLSMVVILVDPRVTAPAPEVGAPVLPTREVLRQS